MARNQLLVLEIPPSIKYTEVVEVERFAAFEKWHMTMPQGFDAGIAAEKRDLAMLRFAVDSPLVLPLQQRYVACPSSRTLHYCAYLAIFVVALLQVSLVTAVVVDHEDDKVSAHSDYALEGEAVGVVVVGCRSQPHPAEK